MSNVIADALTGPKSTIGIKTSKSGYEVFRSIKLTDIGWRYVVISRHATEAEARVHANRAWLAEADREWLAYQRSIAA